MTEWTMEYPQVKGAYNEGGNERVTSNDKMRAALEGAREYIAEIDEGEIETPVAYKLHLQLDEALKSEPAKYPLPQSLVDMNQLQLMEYAARLENQISEMAKLSEEGAVDEVTQVRTESVIRHEQPYEITTDIGVKYSAKGEMQPEASVKIHRKLGDGNEINELIKADWGRGVEEVVAAIDDIKKRNAGVR